MHRRHRGRRPPCQDPIPDEKQARLLDRFGDQGIDANGDGALTCEEVRAFRASKRGTKGVARFKKGSAGRCKGPKAE
jgi:hypothetical protein